MIQTRAGARWRHIAATSASDNVSSASSSSYLSRFMALSSSALHRIDEA